MSKKTIELGEVNVGDTIEGLIYNAKLVVLEKKQMSSDEDVFAYKCKYLDGLDKGDTETIFSFMQYRKVENE